MKKWRSHRNGMIRKEETAKGVDVGKEETTNGNWELTSVIRIGILAEEKRRGMRELIGERI